MPNTYTNLLYHFIFSTKERRPLIHSALKEELHRYIGGIIRAEGGISLEIGGIEDHIHILARSKPSVSVSETLNKIKSNSSKWIHDEKPGNEEFAWQTGYAAFTVSESQVERVREYIRNQEKHHRTQSFQEELLAILERHSIEYDPRYLWD